MEIGQKGKLEIIVEQKHTASALGSGLLEVFSTPMLAALMEGAACEAVKGHMEAGLTTVGSQLELKHVSATPVGMRVWAEAELTKVDGRALTFSIEAFDGRGSIGSCVHERFIVDEAKFMQKVNAKLGNE